MSENQSKNEALIYSMQRDGAYRDIVLALLLLERGDIDGAKRVLTDALPDYIAQHLVKEGKKS